MVNLVVPHAVSTSHTVVATSTWDWVDLVYKFGTVKFLQASILVADVVACQVGVHNLCSPYRGHLPVLESGEETYIVF
jgi:hypothetical protein